MIMKHLDETPSGHYGAILIDAPWRFATWDKREAILRSRGRGTNVAVEHHYRTMDAEEIKALPVARVAARDCALFLWAVWPLLPLALDVLSTWGFTYKTCAFCWTKITRAAEPAMGQGYWTRANSEPCLLATRGNSKRLIKDVRQGIIEPRREHSRKPDCVRERIERLVAGPYLELFAREERRGWDCWGDQLGMFQDAAE